MFSKREAFFGIIEDSFMTLGLRILSLLVWEEDSDVVLLNILGFYALTLSSGLNESN